eukprot:942487-Pleurochrysis_carterae.AAC.1
MVTLAAARAAPPQHRLGRARFCGSSSGDCSNGVVNADDSARARVGGMKGCFFWMPKRVLRKHVTPSQHRLQLVVLVRLFMLSQSMLHAHALLLPPSLRASSSRVKLSDDVSLSRSTLMMSSLPERKRTATLFPGHPQCGGALDALHLPRQAHSISLVDARASHGLAGTLTPDSWHP